MLKNKYTVLIIIFLVAILAFVFLFFSENKNNQLNTEDIKTEEEDIVFDFSGDLNNYESYYKKTLIFSKRGDQKHAFINSNKALPLWEAIYKNYKNNQVTGYNKTTDWQKNLELIYEIDIKSNKLIKNKKLVEANKELEKIRIIFREMRRENGINNINDQLLDFYETIIPIINAEKKKETIQYMKKMKLKFLSLKELNINEDYNKKINDIEKAISGVDKLIGSDFRSSQKDLLKYFEDLYISVK